MKYSCIYKCNPCEVLHSFPNPVKNRKLYRKWMEILGTVVSRRNPKHVYNNYKICYKHFDKKYLLNNTLKKYAVPSLFLNAKENAKNELEEYLKKRYKNKYSENGVVLEDFDVTAKFPIRVTKRNLLFERKLKELNIKNNVVLQFCKNVEHFCSYSVREKDELIEKFYKWLTKSQILDTEKIISAHILMLYNSILPTAASHPLLLRRLLTPKDSATSEGIFGEKLFIQHVKPLIVELYKSREIKVRLHLLDALQSYISVFTKEEIEKNLLPEILIGMQDLDKMVVRATLTSLAHLVDILGPTVVLGGKREDIFKQSKKVCKRRPEPIVYVNKKKKVDGAREKKTEKDQFDLPEIKSRHKSKKDTNAVCSDSESKQKVVEMKAKQENIIIKDKRESDMDENEVELNHSQNSSNEIEAEHDPLGLLEIVSTKKKKINTNIECLETGQNVEQIKIKQEKNIRIKEERNSDVDEYESETNSSNSDIEEYESETNSSYSDIEEYESETDSNTS